MKPRLSEKLRRRLAHVIPAPAPGVPARPFVPRVSTPAVIADAEFQVRAAVAALNDHLEFLAEKGLTEEWRAWRLRRTATGNPRRRVLRAVRPSQDPEQGRVVPQVRAADSEAAQRRTEG